MRPELAHLYAQQRFAIRLVKSLVWRFQLHPTFHLGPTGREVFQSYANVAQLKLQLEQEVQPVPRYRLLPTSRARQRQFYQNLLHLVINDALDKELLNLFLSRYLLLFVLPLIAMAERHQRR